MTRRPRRNHRPAFKAKGALAALKGAPTLAAIFSIHPYDTGYLHHREREAD